MSRLHPALVLAIAILQLQVLFVTDVVADVCLSYYRHPGVCLDPGHGGPDACKWYPPCTNVDGAGCYGPSGLTEAWVNHEIVPLARDLLLEGDIYIRCTKEAITDYLGHQRRCDIANSDPDVDVFISVHHEGDTDVYDTRTFYMDSPSIPNPETEKWRYKLALALAEGIDEQFGYGMQVKPDTESGPGYLYVLHHTWMPAALTEASCIGHESEEYLMAYDADHRQDEAEGTKQGLFYYDDYTAPQGFRCVKVGSPPDRYVFSWLPVEGADGYVFYMDGYMPDWQCSPSALSTCLDVGAATVCTLYIEQVPPYPAFAVRAYVEGAGGEVYIGGMSECVAHWGEPVGSDCFATGIYRSITDFTASGGDHSIRLSWRAVGFEYWAEFEIWRSANGGWSYEMVGTVEYDPGEENYTFVDSTADHLVRYCYKIRDTEGFDWWGPVSEYPGADVASPPSPSPTPALVVDLIGESSPMSGTGF